MPDSPSRTAYKTAHKRESRAEARAACAHDLLRFLKTYMAPRFPLPFSADHVALIASIQGIILHGGLRALAMPRGSGKALALDTPLPTPSGWTTMGDVRVGDELYDEEGRPCRVTFVTEVQHERTCYEVEFDDGERVVCDGDHLWQVSDRWARAPSQVMRTADMVDRVVLSQKRGFTELRYTVPVASPLAGKSSAWDIAPYMLGVWLGDGATATNRVTVGDADAPDMLNLIERYERVGTRHRDIRANCSSYLIGQGRPLDTPARMEDEISVMKLHEEGVGQAEICRRTGVKIKTVGNIIRRCRDRGGIGSMSLMTRLRWIGVLNNKHIPASYLRASEDDRMALLRGLMDTDGSVCPNGNAEYVTKLPQLRDDVMELLASLGFKRRCREKTVKGRVYYRITFTPSDGRAVFDLPRKAARQVTRQVRISASRRIIAIRPVPSVPVRCVQVDSPNRLYLCGRGMVPTHNTTIVEGAAVWALLYGHRRYLFIVAATGRAAQMLMSSIRDELAYNDALGDDFPDATHAIRALGGVARRAEAQTIEGNPTHLIWTRGEVRLPSTAAGGGSVIGIAGITGAIRGAKATLADGAHVRPDLCLVDDFQTRDSAKSPNQTANRLQILASDVLGLAGPGQRVACLCACTVIQRNDGAAQLLDRKAHPEWQGTTARLMLSMPGRSSIPLWDQYAEIYREDLGRDSIPQESKLDRATAFYRANRAKMDVGASAAWEARKSDGEESAIQHAMDLLITRGEDAFWAEYQNAPRDESSAQQPQMEPEVLSRRINRIRPGVVPRGAVELTAFVDVGEGCLWWGVLAAGDAFRGDLVAYGAYPDPGRRVFSKAEMRGALERAHPAGSMQGTWFAALTHLGSMILDRDWPDEDGQPRRVSLMMIDCGFGNSTDTVFDWIKRSPWKDRIYPSRGKGIGAKTRPMSDWPKEPGDKMGTDWRIRTNKARKSREVVFGTNFWKSFVADRLHAPMGGLGALSWNGDKPNEHEMLASHLTAEKRVTVSTNDRTVDEWVAKVGRDNDLLDVLVGCHVAASIRGVSFDTGSRQSTRAAPRVSLADRQRLAREKRGK